MENKKLLLLVLFICSLFTSARAQKEAERFAYCEIGGGYGTHGSFKVGLNCIYDSAKIFSFFFGVSNRRAPGTPSDYQPGLLETTPQQSQYMIGFMKGRVFYIQPTVRFIVEGGIALGVVKTPGNFTPSGGWFSSNYSYTTNEQYTAGIILNPKMELPLRTRFGLSLGVYTNINFVNSVYGVEANLLFGKLRHKS